MEENSRSKILLRVPPVRWARRRAASAQNALIETIELPTVFLTLAKFLALFSFVNIAPIGTQPSYTYIFSRRGPSQIWLNGLVLLVELGQVRNNVLDDVGVWEWVNLGFLLGVRWYPAYPSDCQ